MENRIWASRRRCSKQHWIEETEVLLLASEHCAEIIKIMENSDEFPNFAGKMKERFGFDWNQSRYFQHMFIQDFNKKSREEAREKLKLLTEEKEMYEKILEKEGKRAGL